MNGPIIDDIDVERDDGLTLTAWLAARASIERPYLLVHADDGVIWGRWKAEGVLCLAGDLFPEVVVDLRWITLQQARLFGPGGELLLWRASGGFAAREISDDGVADGESLDEEYLLWGQGNPLREANGFALLQEGQRGIRHAPPVLPKDRLRPKLRVRHYLTFDNQGQARIYLSRLVDLIP